MAVIEVKNLIKDYGFGRGVFDVSFSVPQGLTGKNFKNDVRYAKSP